MIADSGIKSQKEKIMAVQRTKSGKIDKRTKEGKAMVANLAKARAAKAAKRKKEASLLGRLRRMMK